MRVLPEHNSAESGPAAYQVYQYRNRRASLFLRRAFRILLPLGIIMMMLMLVTGLPNTESHASSSTTEESEEDDDKALQRKWDETPAPEVATQFMSHIGAGRFDEAYQVASPMLRNTRQAQELRTDMVRQGLDKIESVEWSNGVPIAEGYRLDGEVTLPDGQKLPLYAAVLEEGTGPSGSWRVLDVQSTQSFTTRITSGKANGLDWLIAFALLALLGGAVFIIWRHVSGLRSSSRELHLLLCTNYVFLFMMGLLVLMRLALYHFTFPTYGIRVFGEGVKIGSIFGVLNPVMIIFVVPLITALTTKGRSYYMLIIGSGISAGSVVLAIIDPSHFAFLADTWFGQFIFDRWLELPVGRRDPYYISLVVFIIVFTIGEALWSPRLMQFTAEIAPAGREGSYAALGYLPYFGAKFIVGPVSGWLVANDTPEGLAHPPDHYMVWVWIGGMALVSPLGRMFFRKLYQKTEDNAEGATDEAAQDLTTDEVGAEEPSA